MIGYTFREWACLIGGAAVSGLIGYTTLKPAFGTDDEPQDRTVRVTTVAVRRAPDTVSVYWKRQDRMPLYQEPSPVAEPVPAPKVVPRAQDMPRPKLLVPVPQAKIYRHVYKYHYRYRYRHR